MDVNIERKDGGDVEVAPSIKDVSHQKLDGSGKKKRRRGKSKRKVMKPYMKITWQDRRKIDITKRNRFRKIDLAKSHAPFNNNQFLMEIHKPEPENNFQILQTPSARTRDSSFSIDSEDNYFYSLPEDEEEYLTKEFSSVYEDAQSERLSNMSKNELIEEYLLLEAKYDTLLKRTERVKAKGEEDKDITVTEPEISLSDSMMTDRDESETSKDLIEGGEPSIAELLQRLKQQEEQIHNLQMTNEKLRLENEHLRPGSHEMSSEDSESDSSSTSASSSNCSSRSNSPVPVESPTVIEPDTNGEMQNDIQTSEIEGSEAATTRPILNGFHSPPTI